MVRKILRIGKSSSLGRLNVKVISKKIFLIPLLMYFRKILLKTIVQNSNIIQAKEKRNLKFSSNNSETYNQFFALFELKDASQRSMIHRRVFIISIISFRNIFLTLPFRF